MVKLADIRNLGLNVTWKLLYMGICTNQIETKEAIQYAVKKLEQGEKRREVCELAGACKDDREGVCGLLYELMGKNTTNEIETRKIRAAIVSKALAQKNNNYINGLMELTDLWVGLKYPSDSPHNIQGRNNDTPLDKYYTKENYDALYIANTDWLKREVEYLQSQ